MGSAATLTTAKSTADHPASLVTRTPIVDERSTVTDGLDPDASSNSPSPSVSQSIDVIVEPSGVVTAATGDTAPSTPATYGPPASTDGNGASTRASSSAASAVQLAADSSSASAMPLRAASSCSNGARMVSACCEIPCPAAT